MDFLATMLVVLLCFALYIYFVRKYFWNDFTGPFKKEYLTGAQVHVYTLGSSNEYLVPVYNSGNGPYVRPSYRKEPQYLKKDGYLKLPYPILRGTFISWKTHIDAIAWPTN